MRASNHSSVLGSCDLVVLYFPSDILPDEFVVVLYFPSDILVIFLYFSPCILPEFDPVPLFVMTATIVYTSLDTINSDTIMMLFRHG